MNGVHIRASLIIRVGLALVLLYAGFNSLSHPNDWIGYVPHWVEMLTTRAEFLRMHATGEIILGIGLISGIYLPFFSGIAALDFLSILIFFGIDATTFRDVGLFAAAFGLFLQSLYDD